MTTLLLPGLDGSGPGHWQRRWLDEVEDTVLVEQDDWSRPDLDAWLARAAEAVEKNPGAFLAGHSLGAVLAVHLASLRPELPIAGLLLVAPADVDRHTRVRRSFPGFAPLPQRPLGRPAIVVASRNDPWMTLARAKIFADMWEAGWVDIGDAGHINAESGLGSWHEGLELIDRLRRMGGGMTSRRGGCGRMPKSIDAEPAITPDSAVGERWHAFHAGSDRSRLMPKRGLW